VKDKDRRNFIYETVVYDGGSKEYRVLNLNSGSLYTQIYKEEFEAFEAIKDGEERNGYIVKRIKVDSIKYAFEAIEFVMNLQKVKGE
jgi:hypothetical protein